MKETPKQYCQLCNEEIEPERKGTNLKYCEFCSKELQFWRWWKDNNENKHNSQ